MKLRVGYRQQSGQQVDLTVTVDSGTTVGDLAEALARRDPALGRPVEHATLARYDEKGRPITVRSTTPVSESGIRSGCTVTLARDEAAAASAGSGGAEVAAVLTVHSGPEAGRSFDLRPGINTVGRDPRSTVRLSDPMVSMRHARLVVGDEVEILDDNSSNGILLGGDAVPRARLRPGDRVVLGETSISVIARRAPSIGDAPLATTVPYNRSPRVDPTYVGEELAAPEPPQPQQPQRFPVISMLAPLFMGAVLLAVTGSVYSIMFVALSPVMLAGNYFEQKRSARRAFEEATELFRTNLADLVVQLRSAADVERYRRGIEHPGTADMVQAIDQLNSLLWTRRPEHDRFMELRLGLGTQPSRTKIEAPNSRNSTPELHAELRSVVEQFATVERVPVVGSFDVSGSIGVSGPEEAMLSVARGLVLQMVALHSPAEVVLCGVASARSAQRWDWLKWLPHAGSEHSPLSCDHLVSTAPGCTNLVSELMDLGAARMEDGGGKDGPPPLPRIVVVVEDDAPVERSSLVRLAEVGPSFGVHLIWVASSTAGLPAACRSFIEVDPTSGAAGTGRVVEGEFATPVLVEPVDEANAARLARRLAPVVDSGSPLDDESNVPARVSFLTEVGIEVAETTDAVVERWKESNSLLLPGAPVRRMSRDSSLRALVGRTATDPLHLDLRTQGPHALVGGTTGAGKSEFLQTWVLGMAAAHSPQRVTFLFVDYKGGSAFADCVSLPHSVGLVTDLSPHLVQRALTSLNAELRHREHVLNRKKAKDLLELERRGDPEAPPSLVIVVDEFAALVQEVPEFVDGVVNVAQRGRSLGLHLILATQRPAGVIKDNLRANTNLRVALRMADEDDSNDVVGTTLAASFDPELPGRGIAKTGPGRLATFQTAYVGGWTSDTPPPPMIHVSTLTFGPAEEWQPVEAEQAPEQEEDPGPTDIHRIVESIRGAARTAGIPDPRKPWLPELATAYDLTALPLPRRDSQLVLGVVDEPAEQRQETIAFHPDVDGNMAVFGTGGAGKSTFLRTVAISAGLTARSGPCFVYGLDFGARGLAMLEALPHVGSVIGADDAERTARLVRQLRETVDERALRYSAVNAASIDEYRRLASRPDEPRVLVLIDGFPAFRQAYEVGPLSAVYDQLLSIAGDGRPVGVHLVFSADRMGAMPAALVSSIQRKLALRLANEMDESLLDVPKGGFGEGTPPGRGFLDGMEVQVAVLSGTADVSEQATAVDRLAESMRRAGAAEAPPVERLPELVRLEDLPAREGGRPVFGVADDTLGPVGFEPSGTFLVAGPSGSGRSTTVAALVASLRRTDPDLRFVYFGQRRSPLSTAQWDERAVGPIESAALAEKLSSELQDLDADPAIVVVLDGLGEFLNSDADYPLQDLLKVCRSNGVFVIGDGETNDVQGSWPLIQAIKSSRHGIVLQPDQGDGDALFRTSFRRMSRADFPAGRGMYVRAGRAVMVQVGMPS